MLNKLFKFYNTRAEFESQNRLVEQLDNEAYVNQDGVATWGNPDIYLENICFIADEGVIFTHNKEFGNSSKTVAIAELLKFYDPINRIFKESYTDEETGETVSLSDVNGTLLGTDILLEILNDEYIIAATLNSYDVRLKNVEAGGNLSQGTNISIVNNTISAIGYKYDSTKTSFSTGYATSANGLHSFAAGRDSIANERCASAIGENAKALGARSHAEGYGTHATDNCTHAEGFETTAEKSYAHSEGFRTTASGGASHAEGKNTKATGSGSHAEGSDTFSSGEASHAEGYHTIAQNTGEHATGKYNKSNAETINSIGIGTSDTDRKNALEVTQSGDIYVLGIGNYEGNNIESAQTLQYCLNNINVEPGDVDCNMMVNVTYDELVILCLENMLQPGTQYRIIDYETLTNGLPGTCDDGVEIYTITEAGHKFDIIVTALTTNTLSEDAKACYHDDIITRDLSNHTQIKEFYDVCGIGVGNTGDIFQLVLNEYGEGMDNVGYVYEYNGKGYFRYAGSLNQSGQLLFDFSLGEIVHGNIYGDSNNGNHIKFYPNFYSIDGGVTWVNSTEAINEVADGDDFRLPIITTEYGLNYTNSEILQSIIDEFNERNYFKIAGANLSAWRLKYTIYNDDEKYRWCYKNGKGVIYEMIDEFNNKCCYDFKNIKFVRFMEYIIPSFAGKYIYPYGYSSQTSTTAKKYLYTFNMNTENMGVVDSSLNKFISQIDRKITVQNNTIEQLCLDSKHQLNDIIHTCDETLGDGVPCEGIKNINIKENSYNMTLLDNCHDLTIENNCNSIFIGKNCKVFNIKRNCNNIFIQNNCSNFTIDENITDLTCGFASHDWKLGYSSSHNRIGNNVSYWTTGAYCCNFIVGESSSFWSVGNNCSSWSTGANCNYWSTGNNCNGWEVSDNCSSWSAGNSCNNWIVDKPVNGFEILNGLDGLTTNDNGETVKTVLDLPETDFLGRDIKYPLFVGLNKYNILKVWNPASFIGYQYIERNTYWGNGTANTPHDIHPNTYNEWTSNAPKAIRLVEDNSDNKKIAEYILKFTITESGHTIAFANEIKWKNNDVPTWTTGKTYEVSIINGLATYGVF